MRGQYESLNSYQGRISGKSKLCHVVVASQAIGDERVLDAYSRAHNVSNSQESQNLAALILELFNMGVRTEEELFTELKNRRG